MNWWSDVHHTQCWSKKRTMQAWVGLISLCELLGSWEIMQESRRKHEEFIPNFGGIVCTTMSFKILVKSLQSTQRTRKDLFCPVHALRQGKKVSVSIIP
jgi:hypothetical protein